MSEPKVLPDPLLSPPHTSSVFLNGAANLKAKAEDKLFTHIIIVPFSKNWEPTPQNKVPVLTLECTLLRRHQTVKFAKRRKGRKLDLKPVCPFIIIVLCQSYDVIAGIWSTAAAIHRYWSICANYLQWLWSIALPVMPQWLRHFPWKKTDEVELLSLPVSTIQSGLLTVKLSTSVKPSSYPMRNLEKLLSQQSERKKATVWITIILSAEV